MMVKRHTTSFVARLFVGALSFSLGLGANAPRVAGNQAFSYVVAESAAAREDLVSAAPQERISLNLRNIDIIEALKFFSLRSGYNIIPTQKVAGRVTLNVENVTVKDVFDVMLRSNNLAYDKRGDIYNVMTEAEYKQLYGKNFFDSRQVKVFRLKYAIPEQAFSLLDAIKSDIGRLLVDSESGSVVIIDTPEKIAEAESALSAMEQKNMVKVFTLKYAKAKEVEEQLKVQLDLKKVGLIKADERTNQVIVQTLPERMQNIEELITSLDKKTKGVLIDCKIIKIKLSDQRDQGIQWEGLFNIAKAYGMAYLGSYPFSVMTAGITNPAFTSRADYANTVNSAGQYPFSGTTSSLNASTKVAPGERMHVGIVGSKTDFDVLIKYLQTLGNSKIMASPSLAVVNNQEAKIHIGERRAYITTTTTTGSTTSTVSEEVTFVDVGVRLSVIPTINDDGYITMKVKPEISSIIGSITSSSNNVVPIIDTNTAETTVIAKDGSTVIIGGMGREEVTEGSEGVPFLSKIPIIGNLFKNSTKRKERVELIIMITPIIFEGDKFITTKDADKFPVKPVKKFDVFKQESPLPQSSLSKPMTSPEIYKGLKRPELGAAGPIHTGSGVPLPFQRDVSAKGFKMYEGFSSNQDVTDDAVKKFSGGDSQAVKGFKPYN
ncbi:MAG: secretin N-terminal domain-containing protein [Candidatus Omnitrophota bacterium]|nr:secretin and TonB N-terminal domain-containing protein [Candidatus Omnitrophota bacterium]